ncbi:MAG: YfhO family protein, partial [Anaerolineae bacterium]|nr:YfhO family protein [Anaerolineae bacterium]
FILLLDFSLAALAAFGVDKLTRPLADIEQQWFGSLLKVLTWGIGGLIVIAGPLSYYAMLVTQDRNPAIFNRAIGAASGVAFFALFAVAGLVVLHLIRANRLRGFNAGLAVIVVIALDLFTLGYNVDVGHTNPVAGFDHPDAIAFLKNDPNLYRLEVTTDVWHAWQPDTALLHQEFDAWGLYNPLTLADTTLYWSGAPPRSTGRYNLLGIKYIIASKAGAPADGNIVSVFEGDPQINIYLNQDALARVLFVGQSTVVADHDAAWEAIRADSFDPATTVVLEGGQSLDTQPNSTLAIIDYTIHRVVVAVETDQPGYLVLSDAYYPGWRATIDQQPATIERANYAFRAVYVPEGQHTVEFVFNPPIWQIGLAVSGVTALVLLGWAGWRWKKTA